MVIQKIVKFLKDDLTEVYCANCGELKVIKQDDLINYKRCTTCGSQDINEA